MATYKPHSASSQPQNVRSAPMAPPVQHHQQQTPHHQPTKQNRITSIPKPCGVDPLVLLQERENRYNISSESN